MKISMPSSFSSSRTDALSAGCETYNSCEASFMDPHSTILTMYFSCSNVIVRNPTNAGRHAPVRRRRTGRRASPRPARPPRSWRCRRRTRCRPASIRTVARPAGRCRRSVCASSPRRTLPCRAAAAPAADTSRRRCGTSHATSWSAPHTRYPAAFRSPSSCSIPGSMRGSASP